MSGVIQNAWSYVWAAWGITWGALAIYALSLALRQPDGDARTSAAREEHR